MVKSPSVQVIPLQALWDVKSLCNFYPEHPCHISRSPQWPLEMTSSCPYKQVKVLLGALLLLVTLLHYVWLLISHIQNNCVLRYSWFSIFLLQLRCMDSLKYWVSVFSQCFHKCLCADFEGWYLLIDWLCLVDAGIQLLQRKQWTKCGVVYEN